MVGVSYQCDCEIGYFLLREDVWLFFIYCKLNISGGFLTVVEVNEGVVFARLTLLPLCRTFRIRKKKNLLHAGLDYCLLFWFSSFNIIRNNKRVPPLGTHAVLGLLNIDYQQTYCSLKKVQQCCHSLYICFAIYLHPKAYSETSHYALWPMNINLIFCVFLHC